MIEQNQIADINGANVVGTDGDKIGTAAQVFVDDNSNQPKWVTVKTGLFGMRESFVPLSNARFDNDNQLVVNATKDIVKDAPNIDADEHLNPDEERRLFEHYGVGHEYDRVDTDTRGTAGRGNDQRDAAAGTRTDATDADAMTRSEEHLRVGKEQRDAGRVRLRKYVVNDEETVTVPVQREEVRLEREPITDANAADAASGPNISEAEHEVTLKEEVPVVDKVAEPVERVRLETDTVTDTETVSGEVRKEQIDVDADSKKGRNR